MKYMAQYFVEEFEKKFGGGAVLAINVKEEDLLTMDKATRTDKREILKEWSDLGLKPHGIETFKIYFPGNQTPRYSKDVDLSNCEKVTLLTKHIDPESLAGVIQNISDIGAELLPSIFRYWKQKEMKENDTLKDFVNYFGDSDKKRTFDTMNERGEILAPIQLFYSTWNNILNALNSASEYFDVRGAKELQANDILQRGKMSVIDVTFKHGIGFGAVLLRDLLVKVYQENSIRSEDERIPILIIIDEVHSFYSSIRSREALDILNTICRKGRSLKIGVIFASQNPEDMPPGINSVVNSKIYFKSDPKNIRSLGINITGIDTEALKPGYGIARIHNLSQLKFIKFPMSLAGVR